MLFSHTTYIGIDPTAGHKPFAYVALDQELGALAIGQGALEDVLAFAAGQQRAYVAVCAPRQPNQGVMSRPEVRQNLFPHTRSSAWRDFRLADYMLRQRNIHIPQTPSKVAACPAWMRMGFLLHHRLQQIGYQLFPDPNAALQVMEVYPHAAYTTLLGLAPFPKTTLEGRLQRQLVLFEHKLKVTDPMRVFEEITRYRLLQGILVQDQLFQPGELDAFVAAFTAWLAANHPEQTCQVGDPSEGQVILPVAEPKERY